MIKCFSYAKINLFLDVEGIREDGYHNIVSVMQTIDWSDTLFFEKTNGTEIALTCSDPLIPTDRKNTVFKAATLFREKTGISAGVSIHIEKNIPSAAGLAGGSADAAAALMGLNQLFDMPLSQEDLLLLGSRIGADVPFCMVGGTQKTTGIGEIMEPFPELPPCYIVCGKVGEGVSTPEAYSELDKKYVFFENYSGKKDVLASLYQTLEQGTLDRIKDGMYNIFEGVIEKQRPSVTQLKKALVDTGATVAMMSGSGPSVFGIFKEKQTAEHACDTLQALGAQCRVCVPCKINGEK